MEKQWIDNLRKRFADKKAPVPEGLWNDIESAMAGMDAPAGVPVGKHHAFKAAFWLRLTVAAAACAVVAVGVFKYSGSDSELTSPGKNLTARVAADSGEENAVDDNTGIGHAVTGSDGVAVGVGKTASVWSGLKSKFKSVVNDSGECTLAESAVTDGKDSFTADNNTAAGSDASDEEKQKKSVSVVNRPPDSHKATYYTVSDEDLLASADHGNFKVSVGVYGANLTGVGSSVNNGAFAMPMNMYADPVLNKDFSLMAFVGMKLGKADAADNEVNVKHRQPVRVGTSVRLQLTDRFGIETGLNYSYLSSDIASGDEDGGFRTEQKLHYVGVPLGVNYGIWKTDFIEVYAAAGATAEFCVSGRSATEYISEETVVKRTETDFRDSRPQWSVNAAAGIQYNFNNVIGVYAEPGVSYYFNNGSSVTTIYKDKPFNFNLNLGLRFTIR